MVCGVIRQCDGTLLVSETKLDGAKEHIIMPVSHTGIVFSVEVTQQISKFLREGKFDAASSASRS
jgi:hypothetical protein